MGLRRLTALLLALALVLIAVPAAAAKTIHVQRGQSIQDAVDRAHPGDTVLVGPGTYEEAGTPCPLRPSQTCAVAITDDNIKLKGVGDRRVTLRNPGGQGEGIAVGENRDAHCAGTVGDSVQRSLIQGITVEGFGNDGVLLRCVDNWRVTGVSAHDNEEYGIFPSHVGAGRIDHSVATGANDTGFYVGQSHDVRMDHNYATENVSGYEIENSARVKADHNVATGNTGGILSFTLPFLDVNSNSDNEIKSNLVVGNNKPNTCDPEDTVCGVLQGTGILLLAADANDVSGNDVRENDTFGIAVANFCLGTGTPPEICSQLDIEPNPDNNRITFNTAKGNGGNPDPRLISPYFAVDLAWDGSGTGNCWANNVFGTSFPDPLPGC